MLACLAPDIDGIPGIFGESLMLGIHHTFGHNVFWALGVGVVVAALSKRKRLTMFALGAAMVFLHYAVDVVTSAEWTIPLFWPISDAQWNLPILFGVPDAALHSWDFALRIVVQMSLKIALLACTVAIYIKYRRTFLELISANLDSFLTDFAVLPFKHKCDSDGCGNRAHYRCSDNGGLRCIEHCKIHRNLSITSE